MKYYTEEESRRTYVAHKDKRRWCKGKRGILHQYEPASQEYLDRKYRWLEFASRFMRYEWKILVCANCGKETYD